MRGISDGCRRPGHVRRLLVGLSVCVLAIPCGCGKAPESSTAGSSPMTMSISGPGTSQADAASTLQSAAAGKQPTIEQYAQAVQQLVRKASAAVKAGRHDQGIEALSQAIGVTPDDATLFRMRADVYVLQREFANARADFSTAIRLAPDNADLYNFRGYFLMSQGLRTEARADFDAALQRNPQHAAAHNNRGLVLLAAGDFAAAEQDFAQAVEADRKFGDAWNNRGFTRMKQNNFDEALADIQQALRLNDTDVSAWNNKGLIEMHKKQFEQASLSFTRAIDLDPMDARWLNHRRSALVQLNRFDEAAKDAERIEWLAQLAELSEKAGQDARNPDHWITRARHLMQGEQFGAAVQDFTRALLVKPGHPGALSGRAAAWIRAGDFQKAMLDVDAALKSGPFPEASSLRGDLWLRLEKLDEALSDYEAARRLDEQVASTYDQRAAKRRAAGEESLAKADESRAAEIRNALAAEPAPAPEVSENNGFDPGSTP